ncbi:serine hydrolase domain-containing protein [Marinicrinis lubricantis]|uniref:Serine hydrolase domain-containing protein n=1 Tax=Marinicrinis lubricantis TaxID=2086470 RepID=A0ABW1ISZ8_9BACL
MSNYSHLSDLLKEFVKTGPSGCGCAIAKDGKILFEDYHGYANLEKKQLITPDTVYRLFSNTKVIVCAAALILYERGKFLLNDPLYEYFPEYRHHRVVQNSPNGYTHIVPAKKSMLVKDAFCMSVGLPYTFGDSISARELARVKRELKEKHGKYDLQTEIKAVAEVPLAFEPGSRWLYGYGHELVAGLIEVVSGKTVGQFLQDEIFDPLGMTSTGYRYRDDIENRMATMYQRTEDGQMIEIPGFLDEFHQQDAIYEMGGAGLYSTVRDYLRFSQMLANGGTLDGVQILGRKTIDLMRSNHLSEAQLTDFTNSYHSGYGYGLGVRTMMDPAAGHSNSSIGEFGWTGAAGTWTSIDPSERFSVVYMHQLSPNMEEYHHLRVRAAAYATL